MENQPFLVGKPSINGQFSMAMLNNQRVSVSKNPGETHENPPFVGYPIRQCPHAVTWPLAILQAGKILLF